MNGQERHTKVREGAATSAMIDVHDEADWHMIWTCEKWDQDKIDFVLGKMKLDGRFLNRKEHGSVDLVEHNVGGRSIFLPPSEGLPSEILCEYGVEPDEILVVDANLLLNEGIQRLLDLLIAAGGVAYNNANAFIGVGDTSTAEAATQTELLATQNAANRFYKGMVATFPARTAQSVDWRSDFTTTEANFAWNEWTISAGATTASGAGFLVGTTNLNRKVQSLGTKTTGTWTLTGTVTIS